MVFSRNLIAVLFTVCLATSCVNNLTIPDEELTAKFHLVCEVSPDDKVRAQLFTTSDANGLNPISYPTAAEITISEVGKDASFGLVFDDDKFEYVSQTGQVKPGVEYELRCLTFDGVAQDINATTKVPPKNYIDTIIIENTVKTELAEGAFYTSDIKIVFQDPPRKPAYFHLIPQTKAAIVIDNGSGNVEYVEVGDFQRYLVTDILEGLNGTELLKHRDGIVVDYSRLVDRSLMLRVVNETPVQPEEVLSQIYINLKSVTESYYRYNISESRIASSHTVSGGPTPISYTNFENGYGSFSAYNASEAFYPLR